MERIEEIRMHYKKLAEELSKQLRNELNSRYNEDFDIRKLSFGGDASAIRIEAISTQRQDCPFAIRFNNKGEILENFVSNIIMKQWEREVTLEFQKLGIDCILRSETLPPIENEFNKSISMPEFFSCHNVKNLLIYACANDCADLTTVIPVMVAVHKQYHLPLTVFMYNFSPTDYFECAKTLDKLQRVTDAIIKEFNPHSGIEFACEDNKAIIFKRW